MLLGHGGAGKTTLTEAMAYLSGITNRLGKVTDGNTISDYDKEEIKRKFSISTSNQEFEPHFTFHGYRYIEISGLKKELPAENIKTEVISSVNMTATYDSSNENVNRLFKNVQNSQTSNFLSLPTDCPQRNERLG